MPPADLKLKRKSHQAAPPEDEEEEEELEEDAMDEVRLGSATKGGKGKKKACGCKHDSAGSVYAQGFDFDADALAMGARVDRKGKGTGKKCGNSYIPRGAECKNGRSGESTGKTGYGVSRGRANYGKGSIGERLIKGYGALNAAAGAARMISAAGTGDISGYYQGVSAIGAGSAIYGAGDYLKARRTGQGELRERAKQRIKTGLGGAALGVAGQGLAAGINKFQFGGGSATLARSRANARARAADRPTPNLESILARVERKRQAGQPRRVASAPKPKRQFGFH